MKLKILKYICLLVLGTDLALTIYYNYILFLGINAGHPPLIIYSQSQVVLTYIKIVMSIAFIISSIIAYSIDYRFSFIITVLYLSFISLNLSIWRIIPSYDPKDLWLNFEPNKTYPFIFPYLGSTQKVLSPYFALTYNK